MFYNQTCNTGFIFHDRILDDEIIDGAKVAAERALASAIRQEDAPTVQSTQVNLNVKQSAAPARSRVWWA